MSWRFADIRSQRMCTVGVGIQETDDLKQGLRVVHGSVGITNFTMVRGRASCACGLRRRASPLPLCGRQEEGATLTRLPRIGEPVPRKVTGCMRSVGPWSRPTRCYRRYAKMTELWAFRLFTSQIGRASMGCRNGY